MQQEGHTLVAELLRRDEHAAATLWAHSAKAGIAEEAEGEDQSVQKAVGADANVVQKDVLSRATTWLTSQGIASLGPVETKNIRNLLAQDGPQTPSDALATERHAGSNRERPLHKRGQDQKCGSRERCRCI